MTMHTYITKQEALLAAEDLKRDESPDYCRGFDDACYLLIDYMEYLKKESDCLPKYPPTKSDDES